MTPKEKAEDLFDKMYSLNDDDFISDYISKATALIAVDEIINVVKRYETKKGKLLIDNINLLYWQEVKQEMRKL